MTRDNLEQLSRIVELQRLRARVSQDVVVQTQLALDDARDQMERQQAKLDDAVHQYRSGVAGNGSFDPQAFLRQQQQVSDETAALNIRVDQAHQAERDLSDAERARIQASAEEGVAEQLSKNAERSWARKVDEEQQAQAIERTNRRRGEL